MATETLGDPALALERVLAEKSEATLAGAAGTGKSTLVKQLLSKWKSVTLIAPTGRAARRLTEVTGRVASTVHSAIYGAPEVDRVTGQLSWPPPKQLGDEGELVVCDEASMINQDLAYDIREALHPKAKLLWVGDPHQLPPVDGFAGPNLQEPDVLLTHVWRSSSGIMQFAHALLNAKTPAALSQVIQHAHERFQGVHRITNWPSNREELVERGILPGAVWRAEASKAGKDVYLITYRNMTRHTLNTGVRSYLGRADAGHLVEGEELFVVKSNHRELGLLNGDMVSLVDCIDHEDPDVRQTIGHYIRVKDLLSGRVVKAYFDPRSTYQDGREFREMRREQTMQWAGLRAGNLKNPRWINELQAVGRFEKPLLGPAQETLHLNFGYCHTCHSAQGGEADSVGIVWGEWFRIKQDLEEARAWWYTAVTRARSAVVLFW